MITVSIDINGRAIFTRSAVNKGCLDPNEDEETGKTRYVIDDGSEIIHPRKDGAVKLAIKMLKTIKEPK